MTRGLYSPQTESSGLAPVETALEATLSGLPQKIRYLRHLTGLRLTGRKHGSYTAGCRSISVLKPFRTGVINALAYTWRNQPHATRKGDNKP